MAIKLTVNNQPQELDVDPQMPLLWAIRDHLKLTGTKAAVWRCAEPARSTLMGGRHAPV